MFTARLPTGYVSRPVETSPLQSRRDSGGGGQIWKKVRHGLEQGKSLDSCLRQVNRKLAQAQMPQSGVGSMFPFKLYQNLEMFPTSRDTAWRTFRVRGGSVIIDNADGIFVDETMNTDGVDLPWLDVFFSRANGTIIDQTTVQYYVCAPDDVTYFWVEIDDSTAPTTAEVHAHVDPVSDGWDVFPKLDATHILLGTVDTDTASFSQFAIVDQVQFGHIVRPPTRRLKVCEDDGSETENDVYMFKYTPPTLTADRTDITSDNTDITADQT